MQLAASVLLLGLVGALAQPLPPPQVVTKTVTTEETVIQPAPPRVETEVVVTQTDSLPVSTLTETVTGTRSSVGTQTESILSLFGSLPLSRAEIQTLLQNQIYLIPILRNARTTTAEAAWAFEEAAQRLRLASSIVSGVATGAGIPFDPRLRQLSVSDFQLVDREGSVLASTTLGNTLSSNTETLTESVLARPTLQSTLSL